MDRNITFLFYQRVLANKYIIGSKKVIKTAHKDRFLDVSENK
jgi:hypothetical protein